MTADKYNLHAPLSVCLLLAFFCYAPAFAEPPVLEDAFSPKQGATALVIKAIGEAKRSIQVAAYTFTAPSIAQALINAHNRGVDVRVVLDKRQSKSRYCMAVPLQAAGIPTRLDSHYSIMHNKFLIIDKRVLESGSFNFTRQAEEKNAENLLLIKNDPAVIKDYIQQWEKLWAESS